MDNILLNGGILGGNSQSAMNGGGGGGEVIGDNGFAFNGFSLHRTDGSIRVKACDYDDVGNIDFNTFKNPDSNGGGVLSRYYRTKPINITVSISKDTEEDLDNLIDELKYKCSKVEGYLDIYVGTFWRRWTATCTVCKFNRKYFNITRCGEVQLTFQCTNPFGWDKDIKSQTYNGLGNEYITEILYNGSAESFYKMIFIINSGSATKLKITTNGYVQETTGTITGVISYDGEEKEIKINGTNTRYTGPFTPLNRGINNIQIEFTGTLDYDLSIIYKEKYI